MQALLESFGYNRWVLPALLAIPLVGALATWLHGATAGTRASAEQRMSAARNIALAFFFVLFVVSVGLWWSLDPADGGMQARVDLPWIAEWGVGFRVGVDGMAAMMVLLTTLIMPLAVLGSWTSIRAKPHAYYALMLVLTTGMLGVFVARDLFLFYTMWEVMLVPMYFIIGIWGGERRLYASLKFFIYTFVGSLLMLVAILYLGSAAGGADGFDFAYESVLSNARVSGTPALWLFGAFFAAFAVKVPMFPFHTWLPDAHVEAPTAGSVVLAAIMLKLGTFGFLRFALPFFPTAVTTPWVQNAILALAVVGIIYGALVAMVQPDFKKLVAYSSVSHLGFVMLGIFALTTESVQGALMVMISHGLATGALFLLIGMIYERTHTRMIEAYGGIARVVPVFAALLTFVSLASIGLPGLSGFVGEFLVLLGAFRTHPIFATVATTGVIFAAAYLLWAIQRMLFNPLDKRENELIPDVNRRELLLLAPLLAAIVWLGVYPAPVLRRMEASAANVVTLVQTRAAEAGVETQLVGMDGER